MRCVVAWWCGARILNDPMVRCGTVLTASGGEGAGQSSSSVKPRDSSTATCEWLESVSLPVSSSPHIAVLPKSSTSLGHGDPTIPIALVTINTPQRDCDVLFTRAPLNSVASRNSSTRTYSPRQKPSVSSPARTRMRGSRGWTRTGPKSRRKEAMWRGCWRRRRGCTEGRKRRGGAECVRGWRGAMRWHVACGMWQVVRCARGVMWWVLGDKWSCGRAPRKQCRRGTMT